MSHNQSFFAVRGEKGFPDGHIDPVPANDGEKQVLNVKRLRESRYMPASRLGRTVLGIVLVILGCFGFLPIIGFWMIPLGLAVLSIDSTVVRRWRRRLDVWWTKRRRRKKEALSLPNSRSQ